MTRSVLEEARQVQLASTLIQLGARLQFLEQEVSGLSRERLVRLYKEIRGVSPPKGLLPFSADWFMTWLANIHASLFYNIYRYLAENAGGEKHPVVLDALVRAYKMYLQQVHLQGEEAVLDFTRAYMLLRFFACDMLQLTVCTRCTGKFVAHKYDPQQNYVCVLCRPPARAGKPSRGKRLTELVESAPSKRQPGQLAALGGSQIH